MTHGYPRPQLRRKHWQSLNGPWEFAIDTDGIWCHPDEVEWQAIIQVPYAPETPASGIAQTRFFRACWYRRTVDVAESVSEGRHLLHFGAVDYRATVWINGYEAGTHEGGYTPFTIDLRRVRAVRRTSSIVVRAEDDPGDLAKPRGKQDWQLEPHSIWYPRTTGIWQTVWIETVPVNVDRANPMDTESRALGTRPRGVARRHCAVTLEARREASRRRRAARRRHLYGGRGRSSPDGSRLSDPGIDDYRNGLLWNPATPTLIDVQLQLWADRGELLDEVESYTALRSIDVDSDRFVLNGRPYMSAHGARPGLLARERTDAPDDEALRARRRAGKGDGIQWRHGNTRRSKIRVITTGPTRSACSCGKKCRAPTDLPTARCSASAANG